VTRSARGVEDAGFRSLPPCDGLAPGHRSSLLDGGSDDVSARIGNGTYVYISVHKTNVHLEGEPASRRGARKRQGPAIPRSSDFSSYNWSPKPRLTDGHSISHSEEKKTSRTYLTTT
jgi:hypothetical protein